MGPQLNVFKRRTSETFSQSSRTGESCETVSVHISVQVSLTFFLSSNTLLCVCGTLYSGYHCKLSLYFSLFIVQLISNKGHTVHLNNKGVRTCTCI